jgi:hypothetical protein
MSGSLQLRLYRIARRDGCSRDDAAQIAGIRRGEASLIDRDDSREPPQPAAYRLTPEMARHAVGRLADLPIGAAAVTRLAGGAQ